MPYASGHCHGHQALHLIVCAPWKLAERMNVKNSCHFLSKSPMIMKTWPINILVMGISLISIKLDNILKETF